MINFESAGPEDQDPALQLAVLKKAGCREVFKHDGESGATVPCPAQVPEDAAGRGCTRDRHGLPGGNPYPAGLPR